MTTRVLTRVATWKRSTQKQVTCTAQVSSDVHIPAIAAKPHASQTAIKSTRMHTDMTDTCHVCVVLAA